MKASLVVVQGKPEGMQIPLQGAQFVIGRDPKCHLRPNNDLISKMHCAFLMDSEKLVLRDLNSTNGTYVNGEKLIGKTELKDGDLVKVGPLVFAVQVEAPAKSAPVVVGDDPMQWLLGDALTPEGNIPEPGINSTVMDIPIQEAQTVAMSAPEAETSTGLPVQKPQPEVKPAAASTGDTRAAADAILSKYFVRRRNV